MAKAEQIMWSRFVKAAGHPFPLPPCLAGHVGRSRYADRLRPNLFCSVIPGRTKGANPESIITIGRNPGVSASSWRSGAMDSGFAGKRPRPGMTEGLRRRLALDRLALAMARFAAEEQGLTHHRRDDG